MARQRAGQTIAVGPAAIATGGMDEVRYHVDKALESVGRRVQGHDIDWSTLKLWALHEDGLIKLGGSVEVTDAP